MLILNATPANTKYSADLFSPMEEKFSPLNQIKIKADPTRIVLVTTSATSAGIVLKANFNNIAVAPYPTIATIAQPTYPILSTCRL